ncbi:hypothetical protein Mefer_1608 (plasmid) [Methanocaldococcus fervens AG86]|uniref:Uncharacterized protein n=1 Tax=Methanocaldococcus fervens (strain DSM 4213 / JCM 15782 / AG86) TaxID=573064 RepID=C7P9Q4_METFA|nr:hypothetical protein Mefer_1608 [Methanocaldococcus fervens AG86]
MRLKKQTYAVILSYNEYFDVRHGNALDVLKKKLEESGYTTDNLVGAFVVGMERFGEGYVLRFIPQLDQ